jgi:phosphoglycerate dehydrogenase-like enzyme
MHKQQRHRWEWEYVEPLAGKTLAVIGLGHVGQAVARRAVALGLRVVGTRARPRPTEFVDRVYGPDGLHAALAEGDFVAVTSPLLDETRHMIGPAAFEAMKEGAYIVDVSRGGVVDSAALLGALERGKLAGAVLDVFETEPMPADSAFWDRPDVLVTPHNCAVFRGWELGRSGARLLKGPPAGPLGSMPARKSGTGIMPRAAVFILPDRIRSRSPPLRRRSSWSDAWRSRRPSCRRR